MIMMLNVRKTLSKFVDGCLDLMRCGSSTTRTDRRSVVIGEGMTLPRGFGSSDHETLCYSKTGILPGKVPMITEPAVIMIKGKPYPMMTYDFNLQKDVQAKQVVLIER